MRIVAVADTHLFHDDVAMPPGDLLVHAGDLCRVGTLDELELVARWIRGLPHPHKVVVAGNHDWAFVHQPAEARALLGPDVTYLEDGGATVGGLRVWGSPWQPEFCGWAFNLPRGARLEAVWARMPPALDLLVTHGPPAGLGDRCADGRREGCAALRARVAVARPRLHLFGHIHEDAGAWEDRGTTFANVTTAEGERGATVIDLDPATGEIGLVHVPGAYQRR